MYKIINFDTGEMIGWVETPTYIHLGKNGCYQMCAEKDAQGIAYNSVPYNLFEKTSMGDLPTVILREADGGVRLDELKTENDSLTSQVTESQLALCDVYELLLASMPESASELAEGQTYPMDAIYAILIRKDLKTIEDVPERNRANVEALLAGDSHENHS